MFYQVNKKETILICVKKCTYVYMHLHIYTNMLLLEKEMATHSNILVWRIPMDRGDWQATIHRVAKSQT